MCVCVCVCVGIVVSSILSDFLFHLIFHLPPTIPTSPPSFDWGDLAFAGVQIQGLFSCNSNGPGGTLGAHTTYAVRKGLFSCDFLAPAPGALLA